jgi:hypothetical protein
MPRQEVLPILIRDTAMSLRLRGVRKRLLSVYEADDDSAFITFGRASALRTSWITGRRPTRTMTRAARDPSSKRPREA